MRFAGFSEDGSSPLPALNLWLRATASFQSSTEYHFRTMEDGTVDAVADDVFTTVAPANPDYSSDLASKLLEVKAINSTAGGLGARAFLDCRRIGPVFEPLYYGSRLSLGESCFEGCTAIREFSPRFLSKVVSSGVAAFARCTSLRTIDGMSAFDPCADRSFYRCSSLLSLRGGFSAATMFGEKCFDGCTSLHTLSGVPSTLEEILPYCFARCTSLSDITDLASTAVKELPTGCFYRCASLVSTNCGPGSGITVFGKSCFEGCSSLVSMTGAPAGLRTMLDRCFAKTPVASLSGLPSTLEHVGDECYDECDLLSSLAGLPTSLRSIGERCFRGSYGEDHPVGAPAEKASTEWGLHDISRLEDVMPGLTDKKIPRECFAGDRMIRRLPDLTGVSTKLTVADYAFSGCSGLDSLAGLPANVELKEGAFMDCFRAPSDWWRLDETVDPPVVRRTTRWCGLYDADMSGWADTVMKLPARCFQGCGALSELPPLPPKLMEMGDHCFAYCTGMKNLDSLNDLDVQITDGSTHFGYGTPHGPTYPSFGEWCFAGCGVQTRGQDWEFFNNPDNPPDIGRLLDFRNSLKPLCDRMEFQAASHMSASSSAIMDDLLSYIEKAATDAMDTIVSHDVYDLYGYRMRHDLSTTDLLLLAGVVESASRAAASGWSAFTSGELKETRSQNYPLARDNVRHDVIALLMPRGDGVALWICCPGLDDDVLVEATPGTSEPVKLAATYDDYTVKFNVTFNVDGVDGIAARVYKTVDGAESAVTDEKRLSRTDFQALVDAEELALSFMKFMAYADAALVSKHYDHAELSTTVELSTLDTYVLDKLTDGQSALSKLRDLNLVTPASKMLGAHCFDGCVYLNAGYFPDLIADVPPYCFANTAVNDLSNFSHVYTLGVGAFSHTLVENMSGFPKSVAFVSSRLFQGCGSLASAASLPRRTGSFGSYAYADCPMLADMKCEAEDAWLLDSSELDGLRDELARADGARDTSGLPRDFSPPIAAFTKARAVRRFGASCFRGDAALTDDALTVEFGADPSDSAVQRVRGVLMNTDVFTSSAPSQGSMTFTLVFHLAADLDLVVEVDDAPSVEAPYAIDPNGDVSKTTRASAISSVNVVTDRKILDYHGPDHTVKIARLCWSGRGDEYAPSESTDPKAVTPARQLPTEQNAPDIASVSPDGYVKLLLETEGRRFEALVSVRVDRTTAVDPVVKASITGVVVTDTADSCPGYPEAGATKKYSAVPLLESVGPSCFEGCIGLSSLDWVPFGVSTFPSRCFAGVPFTHPPQYAVPVPTFLGWSSPTVDAYRDAIGALCGLSKFSVQEIYGNDHAPTSLKLYVNPDDTDYILFAVAYTMVNGVVVPSLALDPDHTATTVVDGDVVVPASGYDFPDNAPSLGSTYGLSGPVEVPDVQGNVATLKVGELTMTLAVTNSSTSTSPSDVVLHYDMEYVSCPSYEAMKYALRQLQASATSFASGVWNDMVLGSEALRLAFDAATGTWGSTYGAFNVPVSSAAGADEYEFGAWSWLNEERRADQEAHARFWFQATVPGETGDADGKPYRKLYAYAKAKALSVAVKANSVVIPPWVNSIGRDCFTFKGFEDAQVKLEALYVDKSPNDIRAMSDYPWGVPTGCVICSTMGGVVYEAP